MMGYFKAVPKELEECARIDGASRWQAMLYIIIPVAIPGILSAGIFAFTLSWNEFIYALVFLSSPEQKTVPVGVTSELIRGDVFFWGPLMAGALLGSIPVAIAYSFFVEHYVVGPDGLGQGLEFPLQSSSKWGEEEDAASRARQKAREVDGRLVKVAWRR